MMPPTTTCEAASKPLSSSEVRAPVNSSTSGRMIIVDRITPCVMGSEPRWVLRVSNSDRVSAAGFMLWISGHTIMAVPTAPTPTVV